MNSLFICIFLIPLGIQQRTLHACFRHNYKGKEKRPWKLLFVCLFLTILSKQWPVSSKETPYIESQICNLSRTSDFNPSCLSFPCLLFQDIYYLFFFLTENILEGLSQYASGQDSGLSLPRAWVQPLVGELKSHKPRSMAKNIYIYT